MTSAAYINANGGQAKLNALAVEEVQCCIDRLININNAPIEEYALRCYVIYLKHNPYSSDNGPAYMFYCFYGGRD